MTSLAVILLAAGKGTRMNSKYQKILHEVGGAPMVQHVFNAAQAVADLPPVLIVGADESGVQDLLGDQAMYAVQAERLGTGHATKMAANILNGRSSQVIVTYGDMPLLRATSLQQLANLQAETGAAITMLTALTDDPASYGRIRRATNGDVLEIVEVATARQRPNTDELLAINEINVGVYCFDADWLWANIAHLPLRQARSGHEYYLTDLVETAVKQNKRVAAVITDDPTEGLGAGTRAEMVAVERAFRQRAINHWLANGVTILDPLSTYIDQTVTLGQDCVIWPNTYLQGHTQIGDNCVIGPNTTLRDTTVDEDCCLENVVIELSHITAGQVIPPFSHIQGETN
ncbi:MAG TPA: NTP transferase domain-containing protein [Anaerolineae bacterium]|nr:NTP transferase domain-containing protein [Anaerolineae bacterium]